MSSKAAPSKDQLDVKRRQMIDSFVQVSAAMRHCADAVQMFADASALANPTDIGSLLSILAAGHSLATNIGGAPASAANGLEEEEGGKKKRKRALKDPNAPKRPVSAYLQFQNEVKNEVQDEHRDKAYKDILRLVAEKWKNLDEGVKALYTDRHKRDMLVYEQRVQAYKQAIADGKVPGAAAAFADVVDGDDEDEEEDEVVSQVAGEKSDSDRSDGSDSDEEEARAPTPPPAKKSKPSSSKKKSDDAAPPSSTPAAAEKKKEKKKKSSE